MLLLGLAACTAPAPSPADTNRSNAAALSCAQLNGKQYTIKISTGGKVDGTEILSFHEKTVESSECLKYGFSASGYNCAPAADGASLAFATTMTSEKEGRMDWAGVVTASGITGTFVWSKAGQADIHYTFEGKE